MKAIKSLRIAFLSMMVVFFLCGPALCLTPEDVQRYIEAGAALDLHDDNLRNYGG